MYSPYSPIPGRRRWAGLTALLFMLVAGSGVAAAASAPAAGRFETLRGQDLQVAQVAYRLSVANKILCRGDLAPQPGFILHSIEQYGPADRAEAARSFGLGAHMNVMAVVAGSPAAKAGLAADDQLVSVNGRELGAQAPVAGRPTRFFVERAQRILFEEMEKGPVSLRISGPDGLHDIRFTADVGCAAKVELVPGKDINAWADGERVVVSAGLFEKCRSDDDLALVIAHEMAHNLLRHSQRLASARRAQSRLFLPSGAGLATMRETEEEADRHAVRIALAAGYDLREAATFLRGLMEAHSSAGVADTHPAPDRRLTLLRAALAVDSGAGSAPRR